METIRFNSVIPNVFVGSLPEGGPSDVWQQVLNFHRGKSYLIEAASGRGKSSFCTFLCGLRSDYQGEIALLDAQGHAIGKTKDEGCILRRQSLAMMFQDHRLFPELTAVENVMLKSLLTNFYTEEQVRQMLIKLGLQNRLDTPCARLSLGQQQRVAFVRTLAQPADFFLLDEPISHLDMANAEIMSAMLKERQQKDGAGVIVTSIGNRLPYEYDNIIKL
ncbi:MAG: ATP-binding cassette domain-containing protein [Bacteroidaceae bacterium]|nr:ATP-binding cassette domain-containing protein [Bacteroidaceae bacterium]